MWCVSDLAAALSALDGLQERLEAEQAEEGDDSQLHEELATEIEHLGELLVSLTEEETEEMNEGKDEEAEMEMWDRARVGAVLKKMTPEQRIGVKESLTKAATRVERAALTEADMDEATLQKMLGETVGSLKKAVDEALAPVNETLKKVEARLTKVEEATPVPGAPVLRRPVEKADDAPPILAKQPEAKNDGLDSFRTAFNKGVSMDPRFGGSFGPVVSKR
jgi:hypothetical protein